VSKKRVAVIAAVALLTGLLLLLLGRSPRQEEPSSRVAVEDQPAPRPASSRTLPPQRLVTASGPVVEAITVEKTEVCSGEDNLVTVTLAGGYQKDDNLRITMPGLGTAGAQMPFRLSLAAGKQQPEMPEVVVSGRGGALATVKVPTVTVKDCPPGPSLSVEVALTANTSATFALTATVRDPGPTPFNPVRWHWDFGDGGDATTKVRTVEHRYDDRPQKSRMPSFLIHVRAENADGVELLGRYSLELHNEASEALRQKTAVVISTELNPHLPELAADGRVVQRVRVHHAHDKPVIVDRVVVQRFRDNAQGVEEMHAADVDPRQILGTNAIPPGRGIETTAVLDTRVEPKTKLVTYELHGKSADGIRASGRFSVRRPADPLPREEREVVTDPRFNAELGAARAKLGRDAVSLDDLLRLRREGAFNNLPAGDAQQAPAGDQR
jgi:PKD domain